MSLKVRRFYRMYGKHLWAIEIALIIIAVLTIFVDIYFLHLELFFIPSILVLFFIFSAHSIVCTIVARLELYPYETLRLDSFRSRFYKTLLFSVFFSFMLIYVSANFFSMELWVDSIFSKILSYYTIIAVVMIFILFSYTMGLMTNYKKARLSFRTTLVGLKLISKEKKKSNKDKLVRNYVKWFNCGLRSYNSHLYKHTPAHIEIVDIGNCYRSVCCSALMGSRKEIDVISEQIRNMLNGMQRMKKNEEDIRHVLVALKNVENIKSKKDYPMSEINNMLRTLSFSDRMKAILISPYFTFVLGLVAIGLQIWSFLK